jgi:hypothetical protein
MTASPSGVAGRFSPGGRVAVAVATAWRRRPAPLDEVPDWLPGIAPLLLHGGAAGLVWWRLHHAGLGAASASRALQEAYRLTALRARAYRRALVAAITRLRAVDIEPIVVKGWAIGRLYPDPGLRPLGDIDLCVRRADYRRARVALGDLRARTAAVDLHDGFGTLDEEAEEVLVARSMSVDCGGTAVRVLAPEDHLRVLCRHLLRHGLARPLWLCDVAVALEERPRAFDWGRCLGPRRRVAGWVTATIGLAHQLLGARVDDTPLGEQVIDLPPWLLPAVLRQWGTPYRALTPLADQLGRPARLLPELAAHWPNGIQATVVLRRSFNGWPRLLYQVGACVPGLARLVAGTVRRWRDRAVLPS